jgi:hypothetical protein
VSGIVESLGDRFSRLILSNDPDGKVRPNWVPGLVDDGEKTNGFIVPRRKTTWPKAALCACGAPTI